MQCLVTKNDGDVNKEIKNIEFFLGLISATSCSAWGIEPEIINTIEVYRINLSKCKR